jgi:transposase|tara:strand:- start:332 stop:1702 length:1371 start_codon:yes stop_codon:yes gene_type:complete
MMGEPPKQQGQFFYQFNLDEHIPQDHLLRQIESVLDLSTLREHLAPYYSHTGRPSVDPELMMRMLLIGYCYGIRSERRLCEEVNMNLAYRWFCRLSLEDKVPDHSTFSKNRHGRFRDSDVFRFVFEQVLQRCMSEGLVGGEGFAVDASIIKADASRQRHHEDDDDWGDGGGTRAVREYLDALEETDKPIKHVSSTDPCSRYTAIRGGPAFYAYSTNYLTDVDAGIIVDVEPTPAYRPAEVEATKTMIERVEARFKMKPKRLLGDTAYGAAKFVAWMVDDKLIEPHVPLWEKGERSDGSYSRSDFIFDPDSDSFTCPGGKQLKRFWRNFKKQRTGVTKANAIHYRARASDCSSCPMKARCCPNTLLRKVSRSVHETARDVVRGIHATAKYQQSLRERKKVEMLFGHLKRILKLDRLRLRGMTGAHDEFLLAAIAQNLRRMVKYVAQGPPTAAKAVPT